MCKLRCNFHPIMETRRHRSLLMQRMWPLSQNERHESTINKTFQKTGKFLYTIQTNPPTLFHFTTFYTPTQSPHKILCKKVENRSYYCRQPPGDQDYVVQTVGHEQQHFGVGITTVNLFVTPVGFTLNYMVLIDRWQCVKTVYRHEKENQRNQQEAGQVAAVVVEGRRRITGILEYLIEMIRHRRHITTIKV